MTIKMLGAGVPRTGTNSMREALGKLLGEPCYHMYEVLGDMEKQIPLWTKVFEGDVSATEQIFDGFGAVVDWPASTVWRELSEYYADVPVVLSRRADADVWWKSADKTIFVLMRGISDDDLDQFGFIREMVIRSRPELELADPASLRAAADDEAGWKAAYERHLAEVRATIEPARLVEHQPSDGWGPLCDALGLPVPDEPYPRGNTTEDFLKYFEDNPL